MDRIELLFEDDHIQVLHRPGSANYTLVTFADLTMRPGGGCFYARDVAEKMDIPTIGFVAKRENWYPVASVDAAATSPAFRAALPATRTVGYGYSMGGYAALKHGRRLGLTGVLAVAPQCTIDPRDPPWDARYAEFYRPEQHAGMCVRTEDLAPVSVVLADPYDPTDGPHARQVVAAAGPEAKVLWLRAPHLGHAAIWMLASSELLVNVTRRVVNRLEHELPHFMRKVVRRKSAHWHRLMGVAAMRHNHARVAERLWQRAVRLGLDKAVLDAMRLEALEQRAWRLHALGQRAAAVAAMRDAALRHPDDVQARLRIAHALIALSDWTGAEEQFRLLVDEDETRAEAWLGLSLALAAQGRRRAAIECGSRGHSIAPADARLATHLGHLLVAEDMPGEAEQVFAAALAAQPGNGSALQGLSHLRAARGDLDLAIRLAAQAEAALPGQAEACTWHGRLLLASGQAEEARVAFERALRLAPGHKGALRGLVAAQRPSLPREALGDARLLTRIADRLWRTRGGSLAS